MKLELQWGNYVPKLELGNEGGFFLFGSGLAGLGRENSAGPVSRLLPPPACALKRYGAQAQPPPSGGRSVVHS